MINLKTNTLSFGDQARQIKEWRVWFLTPFGICESIAEARLALMDRDFDLDLSIIPVVVAVGEDGYSEFIPPR